MSTQTETNRSVTWDYMIDQLTGILQISNSKTYVEMFMLQAPFHAVVGESTFHKANS